jgi:2-haloacid dehalogenase
MLDKTLAKFNVKGVPPDVLADLNLAWHRLDTWPDVQRGFARLGAKFLLAPCSNGNIALMADIARHNKIRWDAILGSDIARDYKPKPNVYLAAADAFNLQPSECMMVAAHSPDLGSAKAQGLRTAHVARPNENGPNTGEAGPKIPVDYAATSMEDLATKLGA